MQAPSFGDWLKHKRKALDLTQAELANQVGCSAAAIRKLEAEERRPSAQIAERLAEIFGIPQEQQTAFLRFARGIVRAMPSETKEDFPWQASAAPAPSNLPATVTSLIGRRREIAEVREYLSKDDLRLLTLMGPPGIGKTRLGLEVAHRALPHFPDGVFFIAVALLDGPSLIVPTILQALNFVEVNRQGSSEQLSNGIRGKQMLLVLDNCEHLIEEVAALASSLLSNCPRLKVLTTSRESLRIPGEWIYTVPALDLPPERFSVDVESASQYSALALFVERARAVRADFSLTSENLETITAICARLDGLPLVIELMAARMRLMSPQELLERLTGQFMLTADGMRAASERQKTLNHAITWSYNLLLEEEQRLFAYLSVFSGGFTLEAAETIFSARFNGQSVSQLVTSLLDKSLLQRTFTASNEVRFNMLVTIQHFALNCLQDKGQEGEARSEHLAYFLNLAKKGDKELRGPDQLEWLRRLGDFRDNLRGALNWAIETGQTEKALQMARSLDWFWFIHSDHNEGRQWLTRVLEMSDTPLHPDAQAEALTQLAHHTWLQIGGKEAWPFIERALLIARAHSDQHNLARALSILGLILTDENDFTAARSALEESKTLFQELHDEWGYAHALTCLGQIPAVQGDLATSISLREKALFLFRKLNDRYFQSAILRLIGHYNMMQGDLIRGLRALQEAAILAKQLESKYEIAMVLMSFADFARLKGNHARAIHLYWSAKNTYDSIGAWTISQELEFENTLATYRVDLEESVFEEAVEQGRVMTMEQAIDYALSINS